MILEDVRWLWASDALIVIYVTAAGLVAAAVLYQLIRIGWDYLLVGWNRLSNAVRIWHINRICASEHRKMLRAIERRRREATGDTLIDELGSRFDGKPMPASRGISLTRKW